MKKAIVGLVAFAILAGAVIVVILLRPSTKVTATAATPDQASSQTIVDQAQAPTPAPEPGTIAFWSSSDADGQAQWMNSQHDLMRTIVGELGEDNERWVANVAPELVYVEGTKCVGNLRRTETQACEVRWSKKLERMFDKCGDLRPSDMRACVLSLDPEVAKEEAKEK